MCCIILFFCLRKKFLEKYFPYFVDKYNFKTTGHDENMKNAEKMW